jgi:hypothetical protein
MFVPHKINNFVLLRFLFLNSNLIQHNFKKIRNNLEKSSTTSKTRYLRIDGEEVLWEQFSKAFEHDQLNSLQTAHHLTQDHFFLTSSSRMRNYLAYDVLGDGMCEVLQVHVFEKDIV